MSDSSEYLSRKITTMSLFCACLVVAMHIVFYQEGSRVSWFVERLFHGGVSSIAVPFFFTVSGYFLSRHFSESGWWKREVEKRVKSIAVPFLLWSVLNVLMVMPVSVYADFVAGRAFGRSVPFFNGNLPLLLGLKLNAWPYVVPLWFLRSLFLYVLVSPLLLEVLRKTGVAALTLVYAAHICVSYFCGSDSLFGGFLLRFLSVEGLFYFMCGCYLRRLSLPEWTSRVFWLPVLALSAGMVLLLFLPRSSCAYVPLFLYGTWCLMPAVNMPRSVASVAFPIYVIHPLVLFYMGLVGRSSSATGCWFAILTWISAVLIPIVVACYLNKNFPVFARVLWGGRMKV